MLLDTSTGMYLPQRDWWVLAVRGIIALLFGIVAIIWPGITIIALVLLFGAYSLIDGIIAVVASVQARRLFRLWWIVLLEGIAGIIIGLVTFFWPGVTALVLLTLIAVWAIVTGIFEIAETLTGGLSLSREWPLLLVGILSILVGILLIVQPAAGLLTIALFIGAYAIVSGILLLIRAFQLRAVRPAI